MTQREGMIDVTTYLARVREDLVLAIAADQLRSRRRRRVRLAGLAAAATLVVVGGSVAATTGLFSPAPESVKDTFAGLNDATGGGIDASKAIKIGVIDDHAAYAAPTDDGGFCLYYASNPRSGPTGSTCTGHDAAAGEIVLNVSLGTDGGFVFGRIGEASATTVEIELPGRGGRISAPVGQDRFFLVNLPESAMRALTVEVPVGPKDPPTKDGGPIRSFDLSRIDAITATARDAEGAIVAHGAANSIPEPGTPTETGPNPDTTVTGTGPA